MIPPVVIQIDAPPPVILAAVDASGRPIGTSNPVPFGGTVSLSVTGLTQSALTQSTTGAGLSQIQVMVGGVAITGPLNILPGPQPDSYQIQFTLSSNVPYGQKPVTVGIGTRRSDAAGVASYLYILPPTEQ